MRRKEKSLRDVESRRRRACGILSLQKAVEIYNNVEGEKLFYFSFSKVSSQKEKKKKHTQIFQTTVSDPTADFLTPPLSSNPQPQLMNLPLISLKKEKKRKRASICSYYQVNPHTWMDGLCSWVRLASSFLEHSPTSSLCSWDLCHPLHHQFCYCYGTLWVISINTQHTNM